jgi:hypothetical protein
MLWAVFDAISLTMLYSRLKRKNSHHKGYNPAGEHRGTGGHDGKRTEKENKKQKTIKEL